MRFLTILFLSACCFSCKKKPVDPLSYTSKMAGNHNWTGTVYETDTTYTYTMQEPITVLDDKTFVLLHHAFGRITTSVDTFRYSHQIGNALIFTSYYLDAHFTYDEERDVVNYDYSQNVIYLNQSYSSKNGSWNDNLHTP